MSALFHITGPAHFWVRFSDKTPTSEREQPDKIKAVKVGLSISPNAEQKTNINLLVSKISEILNVDGSLFQQQQAASFLEPAINATIGAVAGTTGIVPFRPTGITTGMSSYSIDGATSTTVVSPSGGTPIHLGTCESSPIVQLQDFSRPVYTDEGGTVVPTELLYQSKRAVIVGDLNRFDHSVYSRMESSPRHTTSKRSTDSRLDVGRPMKRYMFELWITYSYYGTSNSDDTNLPPGYYFPKCWLEGPSTDKIGADVQRVRVIMSAYRKRMSDKSWLLYSQDPDDFKLIPGFIDRGQ